MLVYDPCNTQFSWFVECCLCVLHFVVQVGNTSMG